MIQSLFELGFVLALVLPPAAVLGGVALIALSRALRGVAAPARAVGTAK